MKLFTLANHLTRTLAVTAAATILVACSPSPEQTTEEAALPISINEVMASLINHSADPIWVAAWRNPASDEDWRELEHLARQLQVGGALLTIPGTGPADRIWTDNSDWRAYAQQLSNSAARAVNAARAKDVGLISRAGDEIVDICESCHIDFKPAIPTMNIYGELSPTADDL